MLENISYIPKFLSNTILKSKDLREVNRSIKNASYLEYECMSEGIISGIDVSTDGEYITVNKGIYKYKGDVVFLDGNLKIKTPVVDGEYILKINTELVEKDYSIVKRIYLSYNNSDGFEVARFNFRQGANLQDVCYENPKFDIKYNTLNVNEVNFSKTGISPRIILEWAKLMLDKNLDTWDLCVVALCLTSNINKELLNRYIVKKLDLETKDYSNSELIKYLYKILESSVVIENNIEFESFKKISVE